MCGVLKKKIAPRSLCSVIFECFFHDRHCFRLGKYSSGQGNALAVLQFICSGRENEQVNMHKKK